MNVAMVKHTPNGKVFWFEVPDRLTDAIHPGVQVVCATRNGRKYGTAVSAALNDDDVKGVMAASGATMPLRKIIDMVYAIPIDQIKISKYMATSKPSDEKIAKRFLEFYRTGDFNTNIVVTPDGTLVDGYTAYLVATVLNLDTIFAIIKRDGEK